MDKAINHPGTAHVFFVFAMPTTTLPPNFLVLHFLRRSEEEVGPRCADVTASKEAGANFVAANIFDWTPLR